jgi:hypothetical protein
VQKAEAARAEFGAWHGYSLIANFAVLALATAVMALAAGMPENHQRTKDFQRTED